jgi:hypothetical protein
MTQNIEDAAAIASRFINNTNRHVFLTGKAGTGKTTFLRSIVRQTHKNAIVAAPTGIAAINAGGVTLHSLFQLPFGSFIPEDKLPASDHIRAQLNTPVSLLRNLQMHKSKRIMLREMELLIIDEVSMLRADLLDAIDVTLRKIRRNKSQPFGGVQILFIGDLFQLPPVVKQEEWEYLRPYYSDIYFFEAKALRDRQPLYIELEKIYRQTDDRFIALLNHFRDNNITMADLDLLNSRYIPHFQPGRNDGYIHLTTHNRKADAINREALTSLPGISFFYDAEIDGDFSEYLYPVDSRLELREGAQVMFIKNDYSGEQRYFNGKIGKVSSLDDNEIKVSLDDGKDEISVSRYIWENKKYSLDQESSQIVENVAGIFSHYPIKLAWAITVHKSQGLTFEKAIIDVSSAFAPGQVYVALSRLVSLDGLLLSAKVLFSGPAQEEALKQFVKRKATDPPPVTLLPGEIRQFIRETALKSFSFQSILTELQYFIQGHDKDEKKSAKQKQKSWAVKMETDFKPIKETGDKFMIQIRQILNSTSEDYLTLLNERIEAAKGYFEPLLTSFSKRVHQQINRFESEKGTKAYLGELKELERLFFRQKQIIFKAQELIRCAEQDEELSRESLKGTEYYPDRKFDDKPNGMKDHRGMEDSEEFDERDYVKERRERKVTKGKKVRSNKITFEMFEKGMAIKDIALERSLEVSTIEGHLAFFIEKGLVNVTRLVDAGKIAKVLDMGEELDILPLGKLKEKLGEEVSYGEIKMILAYWKTQEPGGWQEQVKGRGE